MCVSGWLLRGKLRLRRSSERRQTDAVGSGDPESPSHSAGGSQPPGHPPPNPGLWFLILKRLNEMTGLPAQEPDEGSGSLPPNSDVSLLQLSRARGAPGHNRLPCPPSLVFGLHSASVTVPVFQGTGFRPWLIREGRRCKEEGGPVKEQQHSLGPGGVLVPSQGITHNDVNRLYT